jgi:hypothetical protein
MQLILARLSQIGWVKTMITEKLHNNLLAHRPYGDCWLSPKGYLWRVNGVVRTLS